MTEKDSKNQDNVIQIRKDNNEKGSISKEFKYIFCSFLCLTIIFIIISQIEIALTILSEPFHGNKWYEIMIVAIMLTFYVFTHVAFNRGSFIFIIFGLIAIGLLFYLLIGIFERYSVILYLIFLLILYRIWYMEKKGM